MTEQNEQLPTAEQVQELKRNLEVMQEENQQLKQRIEQLSEEALRSEVLIAQLQQQITQKDKQIETLQDQLLQVELNSKPLYTPEQQKSEEEVKKKQPTRSSSEEIKFSKWGKGPKAPIELYAGSSVTIGNIAYFNQYSGIRRTFTVYTFNIENEQWGQLPANPPNKHYTLINVCDQVTTVGGTQPQGYLQATNELHTYSPYTQGWSQQFPPMAKKRYHPAALGTKSHIIVAGGEGAGYILDSEIFDLENLQWSMAKPLPYYIFMPTTVLCGDTLYMVGNDSSAKLYSVLSCNVQALVDVSKETAPPDTDVWHNIADLPVRSATGAVVNNQLLAFGGRDKDDKKSSAVYMYDGETNAWSEISHMRTARHRCMVAAFVNQVVVAGGEIDSGWDKKKTVETTKTEIAQVHYS